MDGKVKGNNIMLKGIAKMYCMRYVYTSLGVMKVNTRIKSYPFLNINVVLPNFREVRILRSISLNTSPPSEILSSTNKSQLNPNELLRSLGFTFGIAKQFANCYFIVSRCRQQLFPFAFGKWILYRSGKIEHMSNIAYFLCFSISVSK